jgi:hypothetical protein
VKPRCVHCGDEALVRTKRGPECKECFEEIHLGKLPDPKTITAGRSGGHCGMDDDGGPWQQNAVRDLEGD